MPEQIKFGTDGWRGVIADDFTFENVRRAAGAIASYVLKNEDPKKGLLVGYDTRPVVELPFGAVIVEYGTFSGSVPARAYVQISFGAALVEPSYSR